MSTVDKINLAKSLFLLTELLIPANNWPCICWNFGQYDRYADELLHPSRYAIGWSFTGLTPRLRQFLT